MNELQVSEINKLEMEINYYKEQTARNIIEIGKRLIKAKELVPHGEWGEWLGEKVEVSQWTANKFMRAARELSNCGTLNNLSQTKIFMLLDMPAEDRQDFIENNPVEDMTTRELKQAIKEKNELTEENRALEREIETLKNREPEVIEKEVVPDGWVDERSFNNLKKENEKRIDENYELKKQLKSMEVASTKEQHQRKIQDSAITFSNRVHSFINSVGGLGWLIDYLNELPQYEKKEYIKAVELLDEWITVVKSKIKEGYIDD